MRVLITGGAGLIGQALTSSLVADGHEAIILSRSPGKAKGLPARVRVVGWDARTAEGWGRLADGADVIVNLAGASLAKGRWTPERKRVIKESRVNAGRAILQAIEAAKVKPRLLVQASAVGYYGPRGNEIITEDEPPGTDFLAQVCVAWEVSTEPVENFGVRRVILRSGLVLSPAEGALSRMLLPFKLFMGGPLGSGRQWLSWIHLADEVTAIRFLIEHQTVSGPFNLAAPMPLTNAQFSRILGKVIGRPALIPAPALLLKLMFGEMAGVLLNGQRTAPQRLLDLGFSFYFPKAETALQDLLA
jgi:uncharacterized protein (TIGR01777 family)